MVPGACSLGVSKTLLAAFTTRAYPIRTVYLSQKRYLSSRHLLKFPRSPSKALCVRAASAHKMVPGPQNGRDSAAKVEYEVYGSGTIEKATDADVVAMIGTKKALQTSAANQFVTSFVSNVGCENLQTLWDLALKKTSEGDRGSSTSLSFSKNGKIRKLILGTVPDPSKLSRHNACYAVDVVKSLTSSVSSGEKDCKNVLVFAASQDELFSIGCATARAFPLFSRKTSGKKGNSSPFITISLMDAFSDSPSEFSANSSSSDDELTKICVRVSSTAECIREVGWMGDAPADVITCDRFVEEAKLVQKTLEDLGKKVELEVLRMDQLKKGGFGGIAGVGQGAAGAGREPALIRLSHAFGSLEKDSPSWAIVGKGIIFDTGGLHVKSRAGMNGMKVDMLGAAGCLYAFKTIVEMGSLKSGRLNCILCVAENSVSGWAIRPDDILTLHSGRTVEINNTDAEGRLVLGDGVSYAAKTLQPDVILTMATLTGAQGIATGRRHCALMATSGSLETAAVAAGRRSGDTGFPILYAPELLKQEYSSKVADMLNSVKDRTNAQVSCAGQFIANHLPEKFLDNGGEFIHCDIAAPAALDGRATGFGVALISELIGSYVPQRLAQGQQSKEGC